MNQSRKVFVLLIALVSLLVNGCFSDTENPTSTDPVDTSIPYSPEPTNGAVNQPTNLTLRWECEGADYYDLYWGQGTPNLKIASGLKDKFYPRPAHTINTEYYWYVTAHFTDGRAPVDSPTWKYTTKDNSSSGTTTLGYILTQYRVKEYLPAYVNVLFQVQDTEGKGVAGLTNNNFTIYDDYEILAFQEHTRPIVGSPTDLEIYTVLVLDNSTSLSSEIASIRDEARTFVHSLVGLPNTTHYVAIYSFSADVKKLTPLTSTFTNNIAEIDNALNNYTLGAMSTDLYGAIVVGADIMTDVIDADSIRQSFLVVFTDGKDTQDSTPYIEAKNATNYKKVYTVGFDGGNLPGISYDPAVLQDFGTAGFFQVGSSDSLRIAFSSISDDILDYSNSFYTLNYLSPREGPNNHILRIEKTVNPIVNAIQENYNSRNFFHPESNTADIYLVNTSDYSWYAPYSTANSEPNKIYTGTHYYQVVTYLGQAYPADYTMTSLTSTATVFIDPNDPSKFAVHGSLPYTLEITDNTNLSGNSRKFIFEQP